MKKDEKNHPKSNWETFKARGIIIPVNWDERGNIIEIALATKKEEEYLVEREDPKWAELVNCIAKEIELTGILKRAGNTKSLSVKEYLLLEDNDFEKLNKRIERLRRKMNQAPL